MRGKKIIEWANCPKNKNVLLSLSILRPSTQVKNKLDGYWQAGKDMFFKKFYH